MLTQMIRIFGIVQGVGFRPFVHRLATRFGLLGTVANKGSFVEVFLQCPHANHRESREEFLHSLRKEAPKRSLIMKIQQEELDLPPFSAFSIIESEKEEGAIFVSPDIAICPDCHKELFTPANRRFLHPFINCTACGPRLSILESMPYDRERTSMHSFPMCEACHEEYTNPATRRFDAQPVCCHACGPRVYLYALEEEKAFPVIAKDKEAIRLSRKALMEGKILAIKGIGGFHLACDAHNDEAVARLRKRKHRPFKPFALMMKDDTTVRHYCLLSKEADELLKGWQKPILILDRKEKETGNESLSSHLAPHNPTLGLMLPYTPLHLLLFSLPDGQSMTDCLVMTSGNISGAPICHTDALVQKELCGIADLVLSNNRDIRIRCDDSVVDGRKDLALIRRSRGYAPLPHMLSQSWQGSVLGIGSELKNTFCLGKNDLFYCSPHVGDLSDVRTCDALKETITRLCDLLEIQPSVVACDTHPAYSSVLLAKELDLPLFPIQHHHAHILSCLAENDTVEPVIGIALDGTGDGQDGTIWGGEILHVNGTQFSRLLSLSPFPHTGGDTASREGWRIAVSLLAEAYGVEEAQKKAHSLGLSEEAIRMQALLTQKRINTVFSTSSGRLFDAVSALLGYTLFSSYEGHAAQSLQFGAERALKRQERLAVDEKFLPFERKTNVGAPLWLPTNELFYTIAEKANAFAKKGVLEDNRDILALFFHKAFASIMISGACHAREITGLTHCALSGGVMQNSLLTHLLKEGLEANGFRVLQHRLIPANDGGISLGQAVYAMMSIQRNDETTE